MPCHDSRELRNHKRVVRITHEDNLLVLQPRSPVRGLSELSGADEINRDQSAVRSGHHVDGFCRKVVGWALDHTLAMRLTIGALE